MRTGTQEQAIRPLGVIGCLTTGFEMVSRHLWLITLPILIDLLLWLGPRISVAPMLQDFVNVISTQATTDPNMAAQVALVRDLVQDMGGQLNMLSLLGGLPLLTVPTLMVRHPPGLLWPFGQGSIVPVGGLFALLGWCVLLLSAGLLLGFIYMSALATIVRQLPTRHESPSMPARVRAPAEPTRGPTTVLGRLTRFLGFAGVLVGAQMVLIPIGLLVVGMVVAIVQPLGVLLWLFGVGVALFVLLQLVFVIHGLLLGQRGLLRAMLESFLLVRTQFASVMGLVVLSLIVYEGLGHLWAVPAANSWALAVGVLANACVGTGLTAATFVFYRERIGYIPQLRQVSMRKGTE